MTSTILGYILLYSSLYHVDPDMVKAVVQVESRGRSDKIGAAGEVGMMQLMPLYFRYDVSKLKKPRLNISLGVRHLADMQKRCSHQVDQTWIICYNLGVAGAKKIKHPKKFPYYRDVMSEYERIKREEYVKNLPIQDGVRERQANR